MLHDGRIRFMADSQYVWWIGERLPAAEGGGEQARRLLQYGPYADKRTAELKIEQYKKDSAVSQDRFSALKTAWSRRGH